MCSAICSKGVRMCLRGDGTAGQAENQVTSQYVGTNGTGKCFLIVVQEGKANMGDPVLCFLRAMTTLLRGFFCVKYQ